MQSVILKGNGEGYEIILKENFGFEEIILELRNLLDRLQLDENDKEISFVVKTGNRLLNPDERKKLEKIFGEYDNFFIHKIKSSVIGTKDAWEFMDKHNVHLDSSIIRNGQVVTLKGDILFVGKIHRGGLLQVTGNLYLLGNVSGIIQAGYPDNIKAIIAGNILQAQQVRIADLVDVVEETKLPKLEESIVYVNELHKLTYDSINKLNSIRPKLFVRAGGF